MQNEGRYKYSPHFFYRRNLAPQAKDRRGSLYGNIRMNVFKRYAEGRTLGQRSNDEGGRDKHLCCLAVFKEVPCSQDEDSCNGLLVGTASKKKLGFKNLVR